MPPSRPGEMGMKAIFVCPVCEKNLLGQAKVNNNVLLPARKRQRINRIATYILCFRGERNHRDAKY